MQVMFAAIYIALLILYLFLMSRTRKGRGYVRQKRYCAFGSYALIWLCPGLLLPMLLLLGYAWQFYNDIGGLVLGTTFFGSLGISMFLYVYSALESQIVKQSPLKQYHSKEKRPRSFRWQMLFSLFVAPMLVYSFFYILMRLEPFIDGTISLRAIPNSLFYSPIGICFLFVISSLMADFTVAISNKRHKIGMSEGWTKFTLAYAFAVALALPFVLTHLVSIWVELLEFRLFYYIVLCFMMAFIYITSLAVIPAFQRRFGGYEGYIDWNVLESGYQCDNTPDISFGYERVYHDFQGVDYNMTKNYFGKRGEFDRNDESRRASEDIQQFSNTFPDADLTDQYFWDDVLDAKTDDYVK